MLKSAIALFAELLEKEKARAFVLEWRHTDGKGIDDVIAIRGSEFLEFIYNRRLPIAKWKEKKYKKTPRLDYDKVLEFLELELGKRLTFNDLSGQILLDEQVLHLDNTLKFFFWEKFGIKTANENLIDGITYIANQAILSIAEVVTPNSYTVIISENLVVKHLYGECYM